MLFGEHLSFVKEFVEELDMGLKKNPEAKPLTKKQKMFLGFCLMGMITTNSVCWARFERASLGGYAVAAISWMFRYATIPWNWLLRTGVNVVLAQSGITSGVLVMDDTDRKRAKRTTHIAHAYKVYDKKTDGYFNGQTLVFLLLVTDKCTIPVGFSFYRPDPSIQAWQQEENRLKKQGVKKKNRPPRPAKDPKYPTKEEISEKLMKEFVQNHPNVKIKAVLGDNLYTTKEWMKEIERLFKCQSIGAMKATQHVESRGKKINVKEYFERNKPVKQKMRIRGGKEVEVEVGSARLYVPSHKRKLFVMALRYEGQEEFRYICASDMSWRTMDILETWTMRWLVEVFIEDFKVYEGWGQLAKQQGDDGACRGVLLSLLLDLCLLLHPSQKASFENKQPAFTVGSLLQKARVDALFLFIRPLLLGSSGIEQFQELSKKVEEMFVLQPSKKHLSDRTLANMEPTPSLFYRNIFT